MACADSLIAFRAIFPVSRGSMVVGNDASPSVSVSSISIARMRSSEAVCDSESLMNEKEDCLIRAHSDLHINDVQKVNETTPKQLKRPGDVINAPPLKRRNLLANNEIVESRNTNIRKKLFGAQGNPSSHKLIDIYRYIHNKDLDDNHRAENDTIALLKCIAGTAPEFLAWIENNHLKFKRIPCMW